MIDGEEWIVRSQSAPKLWGDEEQNLFQASEKARERGLEGLRSDMDGSKFVGELVQVAELCNSYLLRKEQGPVEPLNAVIGNLRSLLSLVGFSERTTRAGLGGIKHSAQSSQVVGNERAVIEAMVHFRSAVRQAALEDARNKTASGNMKKILQLCNETRDSTFPKMGIQLLDGKREEADDWKICLPRSEKSHATTTEHQQSLSIDLESVKLEDLFRVGQYEGVFSEFTEDGIPTLNADGSELSKRMLKKLIKKREAHRQRLEWSKG